MSGSANSTNNIEVVAIEAQFIDIDPVEINNTPENLTSKRGCNKTGVSRKKKLRPETWKWNVAKEKR